jgi:hypothetical protein
VVAGWSQILIRRLPGRHCSLPLRAARHTFKNKNIASASSTLCNQQQRRSSSSRREPPMSRFSKPLLFTQHQSQRATNAPTPTQPSCTPCSKTPHHTSHLRSSRTSTSGLLCSRRSYLSRPQPRPSSFPREVVKCEMSWDVLLLAIMPSVAPAPEACSAAHPFDSLFVARPDETSHTLALHVHCADIRMQSAPLSPRARTCATGPERNLLISFQSPAGLEIESAIRHSRLPCVRSDSVPHGPLLRPDATFHAPAWSLRVLWWDVVLCAEHRDAEIVRAMR